VIVQSERGRSGSIILKATSPTLRTAAVTMNVRPVPPVPAVA
jgi:hypothetical protein